VSKNVRKFCACHVNYSEVYKLAGEQVVEFGKERHEEFVDKEGFGSLVLQALETEEGRAAFMY
jgi:hypothetical protein